MFFNSKCRGCAYNTNRYAKGCECYTDIPIRCQNYITEEEKIMRENQIKMYNKKSEISYVQFSGSCGKWLCNT
jgi:hypothetical protein